MKFEEIEDYYTYYVHIVGISEELFWDAPCWFVFEVAQNKAAYDGWFENAKAQAIKKNSKKK